MVLFILLILIVLTFIFIVLGFKFSIWYFLAYWLFCLLSTIFLLKKYKNPYKLILLFGKKGSFKSTFMVKQMLKYKRKGWHIYSDIPDLLVCGARIINADDLEKFTPEAHSAIFLDEVGLTYDNRKFKTFKDGVNQWYKFQRKYHCVVYMNSQSFDIDLKLRSLVDEMYLCNGIGGVCGVLRPIKRTITLTEPTGDAESRIADKLEFRWIGRWKFIWGPRWFKYFDSFSAPHRDPIPYSEVIADVRELRKKKIPLHFSSHQHVSKRKRRDAHRRDLARESSVAIEKY